VEPASRFDVVLANINRNVLLAEIPTYASLMREGGHLLVSGFYQQDAVEIERKAKESGLRPTGGMAINGWCSLAYQRADDGWV
jgi:ribosomal protein L11 methyltransferase